ARHAGVAAVAIRAGKLRDRTIAGGDVEHAPAAAQRGEIVDPEALDGSGVVAAVGTGQRMQRALFPVTRPSGLAMRVVGGVVRHRRSITGTKKEGPEGPSSVATLRTIRSAVRNGCTAYGRRRRTGRS